MQATVCGKIKDASLYSALDATARLMDKVERIYFRERFVKHGDRNELKRGFLKEYGITGRQLNGVIFNLSGKVESNKQTLLRNLDTKKRKLDTVNRCIEAAFKGVRKNWFKIHQYKRQVSHLKYKIAVLEEGIKANAPSICFDSGNLFRKQFTLKDNGYASHADWLADWQGARSSQFYCLGSKDESFGNQTCQFLPKGLQLRLPNALAGELGSHITFPVVFPHGQEILNNALLAGQAISYLFVRKDKGWYVHYYGTGRSSGRHREEEWSTRARSKRRLHRSIQDRCIGESNGSMEYCNAVVWQEQASDRGDAWRCSRICGAVCQS